MLQALCDRSAARRTSIQPELGHAGSSLKLTKSSQQWGLPYGRMRLDIDYYKVREAFSARKQLTCWIWSTFAKLPPPTPPWHLADWSWTCLFFIENLICILPWQGKAMVLSPPWRVTHSLTDGYLNEQTRTDMSAMVCKRCRVVRISRHYCVAMVCDVTALVFSCGDVSSFNRTFCVAD